MNTCDSNARVLDVEDPDVDAAATLARLVANRLRLCGGDRITHTQRGVVSGELAGSLMKRNGR